MARRLNLNRNIVLIAHNIRSAHNVGSLFRTAEGLGINKLVLTGYSPYPKLAKDNRLRHISERVDKLIDKTALGAQNSLSFSQSDDLASVVNEYRKAGYIIYGLEQTKDSQSIIDVDPANNMVLIVGNEVSGLDNSTINLCDDIIEIPMLGSKESFNVAQAAAIAMYSFRYHQ